MASRSTARLEIRQAKLKDVRAIGDLVHPGRVITPVDEDLAGRHQ